MGWDEEDRMSDARGELARLPRMMVWSELPTRRAE